MGLCYVPIRCLHDTGIRWIAVLYRRAALAGKLEGVAVPGAQEGARAWEEWLKSRRSTSYFVVVNKADMANEGWDKMI